MGFGDQSGLEALDREDLPRRRRRERRRRSSSTAGSSGSWSRTAAPPGSRAIYRDPDGPHRDGRRSARRRSSSPAARSSRRRCCCARGSAAPPSATTCACTRRASIFGSTTRTRTRGGARRRPALSHEFADLEDGYGFLIECAQHTTGLTAARAALALRRASTRRGCSSSAAAPAFINLTRDRGHGRVTIDDGGRPVLHYPLDDELDVAPPPPRLRARWPGSTRRPGPRRCRR